MGLKDLFRRKKSEDEDDEDDLDEDDFDASDFDDTADSEGDEASADADSDADDDDPGFGGSTISDDENPDPEAPEAGPSEPDAPTSADETAADDDGDIPDFGDDDDEDSVGEYDPDEDDEEDGDDDHDDGYDDEEEDEEGGLFSNPIVLFSVLGAGFLVIIVGIGFGAWFFISSGSEEVAEQAEAQQQKALTPAATSSDASSGGGLNDLAGIDDKPAELEPETVSSEPAAAPSADTVQIAGGSSLNSIANSGGLNALAGGGLNAIATGSTTAAGLIVPASTMVAFESYLDHPTPSALPRAPDPDFLQNRDDGEAPLPKVASDGRVPWEFYGRPLVPDSGLKRAAILVTGLGLSTAETLAAIKKLPPEVTLSFSPYAEDLEQWLLRSRRVGHEVMLGLPLESARFPIEDPGPLALHTGLSAEENLAKIEEVLSLFQGYTGLEVIMGSKFTTSEQHVRDLLGVLNSRGLMILDGAWNSRSQIPKVSSELGMPRAISDIRLDRVMALSAIDAKIKELDTLILTRNQALATTGMSPAVMDRLKTWFQTLPGRGVELVPVSSLVDTSLAESPLP